MCGILGAFGQHEKISEKKFKTALAQLSHRGPDGEGYFADDFCKLGHRRLAIIDLESGQQPMESYDHRYVIVFNGEIYNYLALKKECSGYPFQTHSDTEVILAGFAQWGVKVLDKLQGMFAFALYDRQKKELLLARDPLGIKPLVYVRHKNTLLFASEIKALLPLIPGRILLEKKSIYNFFKYKFVPAPYTIYQNIWRLEPGHYAIFSGQDRQMICRQKERYWQHHLSGFRPQDSHPQRMDAAIRAAVSQSIVEHLVADVPIAVFLSGGIDSSIVASVAAQRVPRLNTFTVGFKKIPQDPDLYYSRLMARHLKTLHHEILVEDLPREELFSLFSSLDEPFADPATIANYLLAREVSRFCKVALSGDGGDEFFYGYDLYRRIESISRWRKVLGPWLLNFMSLGLNQRFTQNIYWHNLARYLLPDTEEFIKAAYFHYTLADLNFLFTPHFLKQMGSQDLLQNFLVAPRMATNVRNLDLQFCLAEYYLRKVDWSSMANSLEVRVPFVTPQIACLANLLPAAAQYNGREGKILLKRAFRGTIPREILEREKKGFTRHWPSLFSGDFKKFLRQIILAPPVKDLGIFNLDSLARLVRAYDGRKPVVNNLIWRLLVFSIWSQKR